MYENLIRFIVFVRKIMLPMGILFPMLKPDMPIFPSSLINSAKSLSPLIRVANALPYAYLLLTWWSNVFFMVAWLLGYVFSTLAAIHNLR